MADLHEQLADWEAGRFLDERFAVTITDPTTRRSETLTFTLRAVLQPLHLYWIEGRYANQGYVSATLADGSPVQCSVTVTEESGRSQVVETNRYGLARVSLADKDGSRIRLSGRTPAGFTGELKVFQGGRDSNLHVYTDRSLYRRGDPIRVRLETQSDDSTALVEVARDGLVLASATVNIINRRGQVEIPFHPLFHRELTVTAFASAEKSRGLDHSSQTILWTGAGSLSADVQFDKPEYKPGESAQAQLFAKRGANPIEAAFAVSIADEAVYQRASDGQGLGHHFQYWYGPRQGVLEVSGITRAELYDWDQSREIDGELDLVGEVMLATDDRRDPQTDEFNTTAALRAFFARRGHAEQLSNIMSRLPPADFPRSQAETVKFFEQRIPSAGQFRDPWGNPYRFEYAAYEAIESVRAFSNGPDAIPGSDDYEIFAASRPYFDRWRSAIASAVAATRDLPDSASVHDLLKRARVDPAGLLDPWGQNIWWTWATRYDHRKVTFWSDGPPGVDSKRRRGPIELGSFNVFYFAQARSTINRLLFDSQVSPKTPEAFLVALRDLGFDFAALRDPWQHPYRIELRRSMAYRNKEVPVTAAQRARGVVGKTFLIPVTVETTTFAVLSRGHDVSDPRDDILVSNFGAIVREQPGGTNDSMRPVRKHQRPDLRRGRGLIEGLVTDPSGAVIPGVSVIAIDGPRNEFPGVTDNSGYYVLDLPAGRTYTLRATLTGFQTFVRNNLSLGDRVAILIDIRLNVGSVAETVEVQAEPAQIATHSATLSSRSNVVQTPRLRQNFVETLLWEPSLETNPRGQAELRFRMADNITKWRAVVMGSTLDGETFETTTAIRSFQPFFADLNPPAILTQSDRIELAVPVRNYTGSTQSVEATIDPQPWMKILGNAAVPLEVGSNSASIALFNLEAANSTADAVQRVSVTGKDVSDAIRKPLSIHPDGRESAVTASAVFQTSGVLKVDVPSGLVDGSLTGELKIYPNLAAHALESISGIAQRPGGCAEQIMSQLYANILVARLLAKDNAAPELEATTAVSIREGLTKLASMQRGDGGFGYDGEKSDQRLTVYAIQLLRDVKQLTEHEKWETLEVLTSKLLTRAVDGLLRQQQPNGAWILSYELRTADRRQSVQLTATAARAIAGLDERAKVAAAKAITYVERAQLVADDPYITATLALAARQLKDGRAEKWTARIAKLAKVENGAHYWALEHNGFFGSWGDAGRAEATGMAVEALAAAGSNPELVNSAILFLLRKKDRYGVWYATSPTIAVTRGLVAAIESLPPTSAGPSNTLSITVNGQSAGSLALADGAKPVPLRTVDISKLLRPGVNTVEVNGGSSLFSAQAVANYHVPWTPVTELRPQGTQSRLRLDVRVNRTAGGLEDWITCAAVAHRMGYAGGRFFGMLVVEIGLPPGADVDRHSLRQTFAAPYEIKPDRIVFYVWPRAGGNPISFRFKPRLRMQAKSASFQVWDYYNPDLKTELQPMRFEIR